MTNEHTGPTIEIRAHYTITLPEPPRPGGTVLLESEHVGNPYPAAPGGVVEITVLGELGGVIPWALVALGASLADARHVIVRAHGPGVPALERAVRSAVAQEREHRAQLAKQDETRRASIQRQIDSGYLPADYFELEGGR